MKGLIVKSTGNRYEVWKKPLLEPNPEVFYCQVRGSFRLKGVKTTNPVAVGDVVSFESGKDGNDGWITEVDDRKNVLIRKSVNLSKRTHILAANVDMAFCIVSLQNPRTPLGFIDRFLVSCQAYLLPCTIVFNKIDLYDSTVLQEMDELEQIYQKIGYACLKTAVPEKKGIEELKEAMKNKICLFSGNSGVGKSALTNALSPSLNIKEGDISQTHLKGKHTTTFAQMYNLSEGIFLIDTPGIKELGMVNLNTEEISKYFPEMFEKALLCKFNNCTHEHEPGCAVKDAVEKGEIHILRYKSYLNILKGEEVDTPNLLLNKQDKPK